MKIAPIIKTLLLSTVTISMPFEKTLAPGGEKFVSTINNSSTKNITAQILKQLPFDAFERNLFKAQPDGTIYKTTYKDYNFANSNIR